MPVHHQEIKALDPDLKHFGNQPADVDIVMVPDSATLDRLFGKVQGEEGLEVVSGAVGGAFAIGSNGVGSGAGGSRRRDFWPN